MASRVSRHPSHAEVWAAIRDVVARELGPAAAAALRRDSTMRDVARGDARKRLIRALEQRLRLELLPKHYKTFGYLASIAGRTLRSIGLSIAPVQE